jgi:hypothetical protein
MATEREIRILAPTSILGAGFKVESLRRAMSWRPDVMGCDAGSTDPGPYFLGSGDTYFSRDAMRRDLEHMILAARETRIPVLVGSAAAAGADAQLAIVVGVVEEIAARHNLHFRLGVIHCEPPREFLKQSYRDGRIRPLSNAPEIDEELFDRSEHIVAMAGVEPFHAALDSGADVVLSGRCSDAALFAAVPMKEGFSPGPVWHAAKILECSAACVVQRKYADPLFAWIRDDHFVVEPPNPEYRCSPVSVASHTLYENGSPYELVEPSGTLFSDEATYEPASDRAVRVRGSRFVPAEHVTNKLEGVELVGHQTIVIGAIRDPVIIRQLGGWLDGVQSTIRQRVEGIFGADVAEAMRLIVRRYGVDGVMGPLEPTPIPGHEVCLIFEITAATQELANAIAKSAAHVAAHFAVPEYSGLITALALPYSPHEIPRGAVYRFNLNHVLQPADPMAPFELEVIDL